MIETIALIILSVIAVMMLTFLSFWLIEHLMEYLYLLQAKYDRIKRKLKFHRRCTCWNRGDTSNKATMNCIVHDFYE